MQANVPGPTPAWLPPWAGSVSALQYYRALAHERARQRSRARLTVYTYGNHDSHILRIGGWSGRVSPVRAPPGWEQFPVRQYELADLARLTPRVDVQWMPPSVSPHGNGGNRAGHVRGARPAWGAAGSLRAWLAGVALLALLVLLARAAERCLDRNLLKRRRRRSQEWPTPNVRATSSQINDDDGTVIIPGLEDAEPLPADLSEVISVDLPPPYSECTEPGVPGVSLPGTSFAHSKMSSNLLHEEPPPPYSDCYVEFSNKNGVPSVLIFSTKRTPLVRRRDVTDTEESEVMNIIEVPIAAPRYEYTTSEIDNHGSRSGDNNESNTNHTDIENNIDFVANNMNSNNQGHSSHVIDVRTEVTVNIDNDENVNNRVMHV